ncbi:alpha/beta hydrolase [Pseudomonas sp.]|jgi:dienelactone hydrolase|uniref:alpha/beta hydrolase family protein n=1 Tax=Pseudomonas sp. TaxID=306 RepID=UPI00257C23C7|nr:alpha/beta hydrolase [Pseudomonas sp.]
MKLPGVMRFSVSTWLIALLMLSGCANSGKHADELAQSAHLKHELVPTDSFVLTSYYRMSRPDLPLNFYIEGDGRAWQSRTSPSADPTPRKAMGLALAAQDPTANVVYLARPCQFTPMQQNPRCSSAYWTGKRYSEDVVAAMNQAVSHFAAAGQAVNLVGYSGGGALAVLIAARRSDVASIRTVAGNLDHAAVNRLHGVSAMPESMNAIDVAQQVAAIAQLHFSGSDDQVVPPGIAKRFVTATNNSCASHIVVPKMSHESDWAQRWPALLAITPTCRAKH